VDEPFDPFDPFEPPLEGAAVDDSLALVCAAASAAAPAMAILAAGLMTDGRVPVADKAAIAETVGSASGEEVTVEEPLPDFPPFTLWETSASSLELTVTPTAFAWSGWAQVMLVPRELTRGRAAQTEPVPHGVTVNDPPTHWAKPPLMQALSPTGKNLSARADKEAQILTVTWRTCRQTCKLLVQSNGIRSILRLKIWSNQIPPIKLRRGGVDWSCR
jgi:hypothetical protein